MRVTQVVGGAFVFKRQKLTLAKVKPKRIRYGARRQSHKVGVWWGQNQACGSQRQAPQWGPKAQKQKLVTRLVGIPCWNQLQLYEFFRSQSTVVHDYLGAIIPVLPAAPADTKSGRCSSPLHKTEYYLHTAYICTQAAAGVPTHHFIPTTQGRA